MSQIASWLLELFRSHGVEANLRDDWVVFPGREMKVGAFVVQEPEQKIGRSVQLDVRVEISPGLTMIESFAGLGESRYQAVNDALHNFTNNSFHVILKAFFRPDDDRVAQEEWTVGGRTSKATIGNIGTRGKAPVEGEPLIAGFRDFEARLKQKQLRPGLNWVRFFYAQTQGKTLAVEVLLNNCVWEEMQTEMSLFAWPVGSDYYSLRVFLILDVAKGGPVTVETAVSWFADMVADRQKFEQDQICAELEDAGVPADLANRVYLFTQVAWGRALLEKLKLGVQFSPEYLCFDRSGATIESGMLADEPSFAAASRLVNRYAGTPGFKRLALMSADFHCVNNASNAGSKATDLIASPAFLLLQSPTPEGMAQVQRTIGQFLESRKAKPESTARALQDIAGSFQPGKANTASPSPNKDARPARPWWRFWK